MDNAKIKQVGVLISRHFAQSVSISAAGEREHPYIGALKDLAVLTEDWEEQLAYLANFYIQNIASTFEKLLARQSPEKLQLLHDEIVAALQRSGLIAGPASGGPGNGTWLSENEAIAALFKNEFIQIARGKVAEKPKSPIPGSRQKPYIESLMLVASCKLDWRTFLPSLRDVYREDVESEIKQWLDLQPETTKMEMRAAATAYLAEWEVTSEDSNIVDGSP